MRIIDELTQLEITSPDLAVGVLRQCTWASPEAYATIDNVVKFALADEDYEEVMLYHVWTPEEIAQREAGEAQQAHQEVMDSLPDAVAELSMVASDNAVSTADLGDALAELSEVVSNLMIGGNNG